MITALAPCARPAESVGPGRGEFPTPHSPFELFPATHSQTVKSHDPGTALGGGIRERFSVEDHSTGGPFPSRCPIVAGR